MFFELFCSVGSCPFTIRENSDSKKPRILTLYEQRTSIIFSGKY